MKSPRRRLREKAQEKAHPPLALQAECEVCHTEWIEASTWRTPLLLKCPECGRRRGVRVEVHGMRDMPPEEEGGEA